MQGSPRSGNACRGLAASFGCARRRNGYVTYPIAKRCRPPRALYGPWRLDVERSPRGLECSGRLRGLGHAL